MKNISGKNAKEKQKFFESWGWWILWVIEPLIKTNRWGGRMRMHNCSYLSRQLLFMGWWCYKMITFSNNKTPNNDALDVYTADGFVFCCTCGTFLLTPPSPPYPSTLNSRSEILSLDSCVRFMNCNRIWAKFLSSFFLCFEREREKVNRKRTTEQARRHIWRRISNKQIQGNFNPFPSTTRELNRGTHTAAP